MSGGGKGKQTVGYRYYMGLHGGLCHGPCDELVEIRGGGVTLWSGSQTASGTIDVNAPEAYGGESREGGVRGFMDVMMGESTQGTNAYLTAKIGGLQNAYRGLMSFVFKTGVRTVTFLGIPGTVKDGYIGANNPYPKPWAFRVRRATKGWSGGTAWYSAKAQITLSNGAKAMNPAHIVYECLTNPDWGMGYPASIIDTTAFTAAADQLYTEGFGLCLLWLRQDSIESFLQQLMDYAGGVLVQSKSTGLFQFNLIRGGYSIPSLPVITADNIVDVESIEAGTITGSTNEIVTNWFDPTLKIKRTTALQALGAVQAQGVVVSATRDYPGIASADLAARITQRDLRALATPLKRVRLKVDRSAWDWLPGGLFVLNFPDFGFSSVVFRVGEIDYGALTQGYITITALQDVFSLPDQAYITPQDSGWVVPSTTPSAAPNSAGFEATYRSLYLHMTTAEMNALTNTSGYIALLAQRPSGLAVSYQIWTRVSPASYQQHGGQDFCPTATVSTALAPFDTAITFANGVDLDAVSVPCAALIENEIVAVTAIDAVAGTATIGRGAVDTVPASHASGARIWFFDDFVGSDGVQYVSGESVDAKELTSTTGGTLDIASAPTITVPIVGRQALPYPPANFRVNGTRWDQVSYVTGQITLAWAERNRITQADQLLDNLAATVTPEAGTTYTITLKDGSGTPFYTATGVTGTSWTWPAPDDIHTQIQMVLTAVRSGLSSWQSQTLPVKTRYGYGLNYGTNYGSA